MENKIFQISNPDKFREACLEVFLYQAQHCEVYKKYIELLEIQPSAIKTVEEIPFLPISFFKSHKVITSLEKEPEIQAIFSSSSTTGMTPSHHYLTDTKIYKDSFIKSFELFYGALESYTLLALLPSYLERKGSSLIYMIDEMIKQTNTPESGYYLYNHQELYDTIIKLQSEGKKIILFGVTFALLDFVKDYTLESSDMLVFETGGMKGRGEELPREEVHRRLTSALGVTKIHSEYGMCELLSQGYSSGDGIFVSPPWMQIIIRDLIDPYKTAPLGERGGVNIIDLANLNSCSFIETEDLGVLFPDGSYRIEGRISKSERRGCNMLLE